MGPGTGSGLARSAGSSRTRPPAPPLPSAGDRINEFDLVQPIGAGGMGAVFLASDTRLDRQVAVKILPPDQAVDPEVVQRFYQEGRAAARLDHENIARVFTIGHDDRYHYIAFEYIEGTTIRQRVERDGPLPVDEAINYTLQIANALVHAAERGVVHRDIKPSNIIVTPQGRAKLVDMGLARHFERGRDDGLTQSGMTLGTFDYISPEQARDPRDVDVRSDLYSLGCTLFHVLAGRPPFPEGTVVQKLLQHQEEPPPDIRAINPAVPDDLAAILTKLMAKDRDRRYQAPEQLVRDLLMVAGALGLRSLSPEGLVWMAPTPPPAWERHLVWVVPALAFGLVVAAMAWWGQDGFDPPAAGPQAVAPTPPRVGPAPADSGPAPAERPDRAAEPDPTGPPAEAGPAAARPPREIAVDSSEDLLAVLAQAPARATVVLTDDGPYILRGGRPALVRPDLTLRADLGVQPQLRLARDSARPATPGGGSSILEVLGGRLRLEDLEFYVEAEAGDAPAAAIAAEDAELTLVRCRFRRGGASAPRGRAAALRLRGRAPASAALAARPFTPAGLLAGPFGVALPAADPASADRPPAVRAEACHFAGGQAGVLGEGPVDLEFRDCTFGGAEPALWLDNPDSAAVPAEVRLRHVSILAGAGPVFRFAGAEVRVRLDDSVVAPGRDGSATLVAVDDPARLDWRGRGNLYGRIGLYLQPTRGLAALAGAAARGAVRTFDAWADPDGLARESASAARPAGQLWDEPDPAIALAASGRAPTQAFRLAATVEADRMPGVGTREGPSGRLEPPARLAAAEPTRRDRERERERPREVDRPLAETDPAPTPREVARAAEPDRPDPMGMDEPEAVPMPMPMPPMPMPPPPMVRMLDPAEAVDEPPPDEPDPFPAATSARAGAAPGRAADPEPAPGGNNGNAGQEPAIRTAAQFLDALARPAAGRGGVLRLAADADLELPGVELKAAGSWTIKAEPGATRPRVRFKPAPVDPRMPTAWPAWIALRAGSVRIEGVDLVLADADQPAEGRWAAFAAWPGTDLSLARCTVTVEGTEARSAVVTIPSADLEAGGGAAFGPSVPEGPATVRAVDSLLRAGGDLVDVAPGRRLDLNLDNAVVAAGGALVHARGTPRGAPAESLRLTIRQSTVRAAGGLVQLESAPGEPELPMAEVAVRDSILATTEAGSPLFRVDGQDALETLRDRIKWEGHGVAYHRIETYRRDRTSQPGTLPASYDRNSWEVAVGLRETVPTHADVRFARPWQDGRRAWTLALSDVRLAPGSPAAASGPDLDRIPDPPAR